MKRVHGPLGITDNDHSIALFHEVHSDIRIVLIITFRVHDLNAMVLVELAQNSRPAPTLDKPSEWYHTPVCAFFSA
jgi:hypothetical protein